MWHMPIVHPLQSGRDFRPALPHHRPHRRARGARIRGEIVGRDVDEHTAVVAICAWRGVTPAHAQIVGVAGTASAIILNNLFPRTRPRRAASTAAPASLRAGA
jgi:hypothetical protein